MFGFPLMSVLVSFLMAGLPVVAQESTRPRVTTFSPQGEVLNVSQIRVGFSVPMVRMGDPAARAPVEGPCLRNGEGRWIDSKNWVYDFAENMRTVGRCVIRARAGLVSLAGAALAGPSEFMIDTGGGHIEELTPRWGEVDPEQIFIVRTDQPVARESVSKAAYFIIEGLGDRVPVVVLSKGESEKFLADYLRIHSWEREELEASKTRTLFVKASRPFPEGARVSLIWPKGIKALDGAATVEEQAFELEIRPEFRATVSCERAGGAEDPCVPLSPIAVTFNSPVSCRSLSRVAMKDASGRSLPSDLPSSPDARETCTRVEFSPPFPEEATLSVAVGSGIRDTDGRLLANENRFPLEMKTGPMPPLIKFAADFGILEDSAGPMIPVTVRMIEKKISFRRSTKTIRPNSKSTEVDARRAIELLREVRNDPYGSSPRYSAETDFETVVIEKPHGENDFEVAGLPVPGRGFHVVEVESERLGQSFGEEKYFVRSAVLVTAMSVHMKTNGEEALVWVTRLEDSRPVEGAETLIMNCAGQIIAKGKTGADGIALVRGNVAEAQKGCWDGIYAFAIKGTDMSFTSSSWTSGIEAWRFRVTTGSDIQQNLIHSIFDRTLLKPGETLSMKHVFRRSSLRGFNNPEPKVLPKKMTIRHDSGLQKFEIPLQWNTQLGTSLAQWKIPPEAKLGGWSVELEGDDVRESTGRVRVENFKLPYLKAHLKTPSDELIRTDRVEAHLGVEYLAGGPAAGLEAVFRWAIEDHYFYPKDDSLGQFQFLQGDVSVGGGMRRQNRDRNVNVSWTPLKLDQQGGAKISMSGWKSSSKVRRLTVQTDYRDPNGDNQILSRSRILWPADRLIGVRPVGWSRLRSEATFEAVVLDLEEKPVGGVEVEIDLYTVQYFSHRKRLVGGYYEYEDYEKIEKAGRLCRGKTDQSGLLRCKGSSTKAGMVYAVARIRDTKNQSVASHASQWLVAKSEELWFGATEGDRIDLTTSRSRYEPGEEAEFHIQTPFPEARALVTVEREGIIHYEVRTIRSSDPILRLKVRPDWAPNVFVSVLLLRGRAGEFKPTALLDLGKPAMKMGLSEIKVGWRKHALKIEVETDRPVYEIRSKAKARIQVRDAEDKPTTSDLAVAVVDEGLLQLAPNQSWDLLSAMMRSRPLSVSTATSQGMVIGRRHFGLKARAQGGDGGMLASRENFEPLLLWRGSVRTDAEGRAEIEFPLNDSLSSFRVVAIALTGRDQFGTGSASFRTHRDLMVFAGAPVFSRTGDELRLEYTLRNTSEKTMAIEGKLSSTPAAVFAPQKISLKPGESALMGWSFKAPPTAGDRVFELVSLSDGKVVDRLKTKMRVQDLWEVSTRQATMERVEGARSVYLEPLAGAVPGKSRIDIALSSSMIGGQRGLREFWERYPYTCLEQKISRIVGLNDRSGWKILESRLDSYMDSEGLLRLYPSQREGQATLNIYFLELIGAARLPLNKEIEERLLGGVQAFLERPATASGPLMKVDDEDRLSAVALLSAKGKFKRSWMDGLEMKPNQLTTSALLDLWAIYERETGLTDREEKLPSLENLIRSRMTFSGARLVLSDEMNLNRWWSYRDRDSTTAKLILRVVDREAWSEDVPKMTRGFVARQTSGHWPLTMANAWGRLALDAYRTRFERLPVQGESRVQLAGAEKSVEWKNEIHDVMMAGVERKETMKIEHRGQGTPWALIRLVGAVPRTSPVSSGFTIEKKIKEPQAVYRRGDIVDVELTIKSTSDIPWVSLRDPLIPGGVVMSSSAGASSLSDDSNEVAFDGPRWGPFEERKFDEFIVTFSYLSKGTHQYHYRLRLNQSGQFSLPATRIEAMYDPDLFGETPNSSWKVVPE